MKIAIVYPHVNEVGRFKYERKEYPPFGPLVLADCLEKNGYAVDIIKLDTQDDQPVLTDYDVVAFSIGASASFDLVRLFRFSQSFNKKEQLLVAGGVHAQLFPEQTLMQLDVHAVGYTEGEKTIVELVRFREGTLRSLSSVSGIVYVAGNNEIKKTQASPDADIDSFKPARHLLPKEDVLMSNRLPDTEGAVAHVLFNRGCPFQCAFCAVAETKMRYRSSHACREELEELVSTFQISGFAVVDDNFVVHNKNVSEICQSIRGLNLKWSALSRVDMVSHSIVEEMANAGCIEIKLGIENGAQYMLDRMRKGTTIEQIEQALATAAGAGINVKALVMHGFPGETRQSTEATMKLLGRNSHLISEVSITRFVPLPGTEVYNNFKKYDLHGTHIVNGWDGRWSNFHIHHNDRHWWGDKADYHELTQAFLSLKSLVQSHWPEVE